MSLCKFDNRRRCVHCGYRARRLPTFRECRPPPQAGFRPVQIGDLVERVLTAVGVTKERVERWTRTAGKPGGCGCDKRRRWMNDWGNRVQYAAWRRVRKVLEFSFGELA